MDERREPIRMDREEPPAATSHTAAWLGAGIVALVIALALTVGYVYQQQSNSSKAASHEAEMSASMNQMQGQIDSLTTKLSQVASAPPPAATASQANPAAARRRTAAENKRLKAFQAKLDDQQKQLKDTQDQVAQQRSDLESSLNSTRDDLNGSIARTHDELVALEQRGERSYYEFDLHRSKQFQHAGPVMISLRKADARHKHYDLAMIVDDNTLAKKNINLYEPVWINGTDMQQLQVVVNKVDKNHVHGYVSAPKFNQAAGITNVSARSSGTSSDTSSAPAINPAATSTDSSPTTPQ
ncbi:MAG TPA: hypothetical protein VJO53_14790 [Candidatus Acidoferrales bacterium]|nr:hypothetical protein [Candidatus Acidoferrales bacterium]